MKAPTLILSLTLFICLSFYKIVSGQTQSETLISNFFKNPDIEINTPGFDKTDGFMNYNEMMNFLNHLAEKHSDIMSICFVGESILEKKIPVVYLNNTNKNVKVKIWMQGGLHGNEPAGTESLLMFIDYLVNTSSIDSILNQVSFAFIPMANIDGYEKQKRTNEHNVDLNRDQVTLEQKESVYLKQAFTDFSPEVAIDFHEFRPIRKELDDFSKEKLSISQDVLFLPSGNLNIPVQLRNLTRELYLNNIKKNLAQNEITFEDYFSPNTREDGTSFLKMGGGSPRSSSTSYGLTNAVSILFEIRGIGLGRDSYKRRVYSGFLIANSILETTLKDHSKVIKAVEISIKRTVKRSNPIVLSSNPSTCSAEVNFIDIKNNKYIPLIVEIADAGQSKAVTFRKRPKAYILLADNGDIVKKLKVLGLEVDTLNMNKRLKTEVFQLTTGNQKTNSGDDEISILRQIRLFPKGSFVISTAQKNANIAISVLEPEMVNGYYKYKMIEAMPNGEIPIYRCMSNIK